MVFLIIHVQNQVMKLLIIIWNEMHVNVIFYPPIRLPSVHINMDAKYSQNLMGSTAAALSSAVTSTYDILINLYVILPDNDNYLTLIDLVNFLDIIPA